MSELIKTIDDEVSIKSYADHNGFGLSVIHKEKGQIGYKEFSWEKYGTLLEGLWNNYLIKDEKPKLAGYIISNEGLITETLHYIAPSTWYFPIGSLPELSSIKESLIYWLKSKNPIISRKVTSEEYNLLNQDLDEILRINIERKQKNNSKQ